MDPNTIDDFLAKYRRTRECFENAPKLDQDALLLRGDRGTLEFGRGLNQAEAKWLYDLIRYVLSH